MQLRLEQLSKHLNAGDLGGSKRLYTLHGDEPLFSQEAGDAIRQAARAAGYSERNILTMVGAHPNWESLLNAGCAMSLFGDRQFIDLRIPSGKPGKEGSACIHQFLLHAANNPDLFTLITLPRLDKTQQNSAWFMALEQQGVTIRCDPLTRHDLPLWVTQRLLRQGQQFATGEDGQRALAFLVDKVEGNLIAAHQEIIKLGLIYPSGILTWEQISQAVVDVTRFTTDKLSEATLSGQTHRALRMIDSIEAEGVSAVYVHWSLAQDIQALYGVRYSIDQGKTLSMALREQRIWGHKERLIEQLAPQINHSDLLRLLKAASTVDGIVKGLTHPQWPTNPWLALRRLAFGISRLAAQSYKNR